MINRFIVFAFDVFGANGGWGDFVSSHADLADAVTAAKAQNLVHDVTEIIDMASGEDVTPWRTREAPEGVV